MDRLLQEYDSSMSYLAARLRNSLRRSRLRSSVQWAPLKDPRNGYTVIVPLPWQCWDLAFVPLLALQRARRTRGVEVILAINATEQSMLRRHGQWNVASTVKMFASLSLRLVYFTPKQERLARQDASGIADRWLNLVNGLANARTRHALLHDPETIVTDLEFFEKHYEVAAAGNNTFTGIQRDDRYRSERSTDLLTPTELMVDVAAIRSLFSPIDLYPRVRAHEGRRILCDLLGDAQWRLPDASRVLHELHAEQVVNLSPLFSHWSAMKFAAQTFAPQKSSPLPVIPYFRRLQGDLSDMKRVCEAFELHQSAIKIDGCVVDFSNLDQPGRDRVAHQIESLDRHFTGTHTPEVRRYAHALAEHSPRGISSEPPIPEIVITDAGRTASASRSGPVRP